mgnify:FL=1|jgi:hypothetical protein
MMDFKNIMQHGLVIFHDDNNTTTVKKIATPTSPTEVLHNEVGPDCSIKNFPLYDTAVAFCEQFIECGLEEANLQEAKVQLAFNPTGHLMKVKNLENVKAASYEEAMEMATQQATAFLEEEGLVKKVGDNFEVKVIPV